MGFIIEQGGGSVDNISVPKGLCKYPNIFQKSVSNLFRELEYFKNYIGDLWITTNESESSLFNPWQQ